jgi:threonyl-tRNA synthetase
MVDFIIFSLIILVVVTLLISVVRLRLKNVRLASELLQSSLDQNILLTKLAEELKRKEEVSLEKTDGFLKFISESRELAFEYIETMQEALVKFKDKVGPEIEYMLTYGTATGDNLQSKSFLKIEKAYKELIKETLPVEKQGKE